jgi:hypothetical protein
MSEREWAQMVALKGALVRRFFRRRRLAAFHGAPTASYRRRTTRMVPVKAERNGLGFLPLSLSSLGRIPGGRPPPPPRVTRRIALFTNNTNKELLLAVDAPVRRITQPVPTRKDVKGT